MAEHIDDLEMREVDGAKHYFRTRDGVQVCGSRLRNRPDMTRCGSRGLGEDNGRCYRHGKGAGRPVIHGRYSKYLPRHMAEAIEASRADPALLNLDEICATMDGVVKRAAQMVAERDSPDYRKKLRATWREVKKARDSGDAEGMAEALNRLGGQIERGAAEAASLEFFQTSVEKTAKMMEGNWRVRLNKANSINSEHVIALFAQFCDIVSKICTIPSEVTQVQRACHQLLQLGKVQVPDRKPKAITVEAEVKS